MKEDRFQNQKLRNRNQNITHTAKTLPAVNRTYKDTLFRMIFREKQNLLQLYNALNGTNYTDETDLEIVTLENAIYMNLKNDVAFIISDQLNLYEHQSTYNPNIPLRDLFYIGREYEKLVSKKSLYSCTKIQIPNPRFVLFYNGTKTQEERTELKLSELYCQAEKTPELELTVCMININNGYNDNMKEQCKLLSDYMQYVNKVRTYAEFLPIREAVEQAVKECLEEKVLVDFLSKYRQEAIQLSIFEYDEEKELRLLRQAERQGALEEGLKQGIQQGIRQGVEDGIRNLMETMKLSLNQAMDALKIPADEQPMYAARIRKH